MHFNIHPINLVRALSSALELSTGGLSRHHWRTALISDRIATYAGVDDLERQRLILAALLHDIGAASNWTERMVHAAIYFHAEEGYELLKNSPQLGFLAVPVRHHHDHWDGSSPSGLSGADIPIASRIIHIADRLELMLKDDTYVFEQGQEILSTIQRGSGTLFDPELVRVLHEVVSRRESFWLDLINPHYYEDFFREVNTHWRMQFRMDDVINIAEIFATIIDRTSSFTASHSRRVAEVAAFLAQTKGYSQDEVKQMRIAGLFHDLGKLAIPNHLLEKPGKLTEKEFAIIKQHTYYTYRILEQIDGFEMIAEWAAYHHETLDGNGYPFRIQEDSLKMGSRIVAVADVFTALTEDRPYRKTLSVQEVQKIMLGMVGNRKLDGHIVAELFANYDKLRSGEHALPSQPGAAVNF
jgi:HD-GYP domain-containing protein (c-di-GMP phosphodiesterase class II)